MGTKGIIVLVSSALIVSFFSCTSGEATEDPGPGSYYSEQHRPQFHFTPDSMWMNDPNGMVYYEGEYHLFYQHHPFSNVWGPMHWGHAISEDLIHWEHLPIALYPDSLGTIFSGSAVIDWNNSSGLGNGKEPPMVAIFTHHNHELEKAGSDLFQYQSIAYSPDRGRTWIKYQENPVLKNPGIRDFRDPKVSWYEEGQKWMMVFAAHDRILFYSSPNLTDWEKESEFSMDRAPGEGVWECPDFFPLSIGEEDKWILLVSIGNGGPNGGSGTKYYLGDFNGKTFTCDHPEEGSRWIDYGKDNYAGVTWSDIPSEDGRRLFMGWMSNWQYAQSVPTARWRSAMTLPRELRLKAFEEGYRLTSLPAAELTQLQRKQVQLTPGTIKGKQAIKIGKGWENALYEIDLVFEIDTNADPGIEFGFLLENETGQSLVAGFSTSRKEIFVDRSNSGDSSFSDQFPGVHSAPLQISPDGSIRFHAFADLSSLELFIDDGEVVLTELFFPETPFKQISLYSNGDDVRLKKGSLYVLNKVW
jgi:fructan beta-fructosidase